MKRLQIFVALLVIVGLVSAPAPALAKDFTWGRSGSVVIIAPDAVSESGNWGYPVQYKLSIPVRGPITWHISFTDDCLGNRGTEVWKNGPVMINTTIRPSCNGYVPARTITYLKIHIVAQTRDGKSFIGTKVIKVIENTFSYTITGPTKAKVGDVLSYKVNSTKQCSYTNIHTVVYNKYTSNVDAEYKTLKFVAKFSGAFNLRIGLTCNYVDPLYGKVSMVPSMDGEDYWFGALNITP